MMAVVLVSAINPTTVEVTMNNDVEEVGIEDFTFAPELEVVKATKDGKVVTLTTLRQETGKEYKVNYKGEDTGKVFTGFAEIDKVTFETVDFNKQIGNNFELVAKVVDQSGNALAGKEVRLQAPGTYSVFEEVIELYGITDAEGKVTFTWTRSNETGASRDSFTVIAVEKPIVRKTGSVTWTLAKDLVTIDTQAKKTETLSHESAFEFTVNAKDEESANFKGELVLDFDIDPIAGKTASDVSIQESANNNVKIQVWNNEKWEDMAGAKADNALYEVSATQAKYSMTESDKGTKKFRVYTQNDTMLAKNVASIVTKVWYDLDGVAGMGDTDPRAVTAKKSYVAAKPVIKLEAKEDRDILATTALADSNTHYKTYTLSVKDQFGNPFRGDVVLGSHRSSDGNVTTSDTGTWTYELDAKQDGTFASPVTIMTTGSQTAVSGRTLNTRIGATGTNAITNEDSTADLRLASSAAGKMELIALVDVANPTGQTADAAGVIDSNDVYTKASEIESQARTAKDFAVTEVNEGKPATGGLKVWKVEATDQFGADVTTANQSLINDVSLHLYDKDMAAIDASTGVNENLYIDLDGSTKGKVSANWASETNTTALTTGTDVTLDDQDPTVFPFYIAMDGGAADTKYNLRIWNDHASGTDNVYDTGEATELFSVEYAAQKLTAGEFSDIQAVNGATVVKSSDNSVAYIDHSSGTNPGEIDLTYDLKDQSGQALNLSGKSGVTVTWTVANNGNEDITVDNGKGAVTLAKGTSATYTNTSSAAAVSVANLTIKATGETDVVVTAKATGEAGNGATTKLFFNENIVAATDGTYQGTVVAFDHTTPAADDDSGWIILNTEVGYVVVPQNLGTQTYKVNGTTATETQFKKALAVGQTLKVDATTANAAFELIK